MTNEKTTEVKPIDPASEAAEVSPETTSSEVTTDTADNTASPEIEVPGGTNELTGKEPEPEPAAEPAAEAAPVEPSKVDEEVKPETVDPEVVQEPAKEVAPEPAAAPAVVEETANLSEEEQYLKNVRENGTDAQKKILAAIDLYCERFRPRAPVEGTQAVSWQYEFLIHLLKLINSEYDTFKGGWNALLVFFKMNHGRSSVSNKSPISDGPSSRFGPHWERGEESWAAYKNLFELLRSTRDPETRKENVKKIVLERVAPGLITEDGLRNLRRFYQ